MPNSPSDDLAARLARVKHLVDELERESSESQHQKAVFERLRRELDAARLAIAPAR